MRFPGYQHLSGRNSRKREEREGERHNRRKKNSKLKDLLHQTEIDPQRISRNNFKSYVEVRTSKIFKG